LQHTKLTYKNQYYTLMMKKKLKNKSHLQQHQKINYLGINVNRNERPVQKKTIKHCW
jgi:hypothetical protein